MYKIVHGDDQDPLVIENVHRYMRFEMEEIRGSAVSANISFVEQENCSLHDLGDIVNFS